MGSWSAFEKMISGAVPESMRIHAIAVLLIVTVVLILAKLYDLLKIHRMKKYGEEGFLCKKCGEIFLPRHISANGEPPKRCGRNHGSENFVPVYACTLSRKIKPLTEAED